MSEELRRFIQKSEFDKRTIRQLEGMLPEPGELDRLLEQLAAEYAANEFVILVIAALSAGRTIDAKHLARGASLLSAGDMLVETAMKMTGNLPEYLMQAIRNEPFSNRGKAYALGVVAVMHRQRGEAIPPAVSSMIRSVAHYEDLALDALPPLHGLAMYLPDEELARFLRKQYYKNETEASWRRKCDVARTFGNEILKMGATPVIDIVPERADRMLAIGKTTMRRSVPRMGRNEPCHCGSGKKYKNCCLEADREVLRESSDIAGVTKKERDELPEVYLNEGALQRMSVTELIALDPERIDFDLLGHYFNRLAECKQFDRAATAFEKIGYLEEYDETWGWLVYLSAFFGFKQAAMRLLDLKKAAGMLETEFPVRHQLLPIEDDPVKTWEWIDREALSALRSGDIGDLRNIGLALLLTKHRALGILVCRGIIPLLSSRADVTSMIDYVLGARSQLSLDPDDPITDAADKLASAAGEAIEADNALREMQELFELKRREASALRESQDRIERELKRHQEALAAMPERTAKAIKDDAVERELKRQLQNVQSDLRDRNQEVAALRRDVSAKETELAGMRGRPGSDAAQAEADSEATAEDDLLLSQDSDVHHRLRLIEFPRNFEQRLNAVPRNIGAAALAALGRIAGGEPAAFVDTKRLKACPSVTRLRLGHYRLLFRLRPSTIEVLDLIPRGELDRKVKVLGTQYD
jgi:hypothetical protein